MDRRTTSIRRSLSRNMLLIIVALSGATLLTTVYTATQIRRTASRTLIDRSLAHVESDLLYFFDPVRRVLLQSRRWMESGTIDPEDPRALNALFIPILDRSPQISSFNIGDEDGAGFMLLQADDHWKNRRVNIEQWGDHIEFQEWRDETTLTREWQVEEPAEDQRYDPRTRAWYRVALTGAEAAEPDAELPEDIYWTEPYTFFTTKEPGITASIQARRPDGRRVILALDVLLKDLSDFTRRMEVSANGFAIILDEQRRVIGLPRNPLFDDADNRSRALLKLARDLGIRAIADGAAAFRTLGANPPNLFSFQSEGETYWANIRPFALGANRVFQVVVAVPERDLLGIVHQQRLIVLAITLLALLGASLMALLLSRRFSKPLSQLVRNSQRMGELDLAASSRIESDFTEVDQLAAEQERMRIALDAFSKYVPLELVRELLRRGEAAKIGGSQRELTILFSDIVGFTGIAERMTPPELTAHMAEYFAALLAIIQADGYGDINEIAGDGVVAFWGAPLEDADHASHAVDAVLRCRERLAELNPEWRSRGLHPLPTCFGLASGPVVVGNVGAPSRLSYRAVGDTVNVASRIEGLNRFYGTTILATAAVRDRAGARYVWRCVDSVRVKGKQEPLEIYELLGRAGGVNPEVVRFVERYEESLRLFRERRFEETRVVLERLAVERPDDLSIQRLTTRARSLREAPPTDDWNAVSEFTIK